MKSALRREYLDQTLFWTEADPEEKLRAFRAISIDIAFRFEKTSVGDWWSTAISFGSSQWQEQCRRLYTPIAV
jgi:hypothetical protein